MKENVYNPISSKILIFFTRHNIPILGRIYKFLIGADVYCKLDWTTKINHPNGLVIHKNAVIGKNVTIMQQVTIGQLKGNNDVPIIKDGVFIGAGAKIFGKITIGENAKIGANAVVSVNIDQNTTVVGYNKIVYK